MSKKLRTCRSGRGFGRAVSLFLENLNYATVIKAVVRRACSWAIHATERERERGRETSGRKKSSGPTRGHGADLLQDSTRRKGILAEESAALFRENEAGWQTAFFLRRLSLCSSLSLFFPAAVSPTLDDIS